MIHICFWFRVSVCPPQGTATNLNMDLENAENVSLNREKRDHLIKLSAEWIEDNEAIEKFNELKSLKEEKQWRNWYLGYTRIKFPHFYAGVRRYYMETTKISGFLSTPFFGKEFREENFLQKLRINFYIYLHPNISILGGNLSMVM